MSREPNDVDWDLLADHLGGALDGTPEQSRVARLVDSDPAWRRAAAELSGAMATVTAELRSLPAPVMPDEVTDRLTAALPLVTGGSGTGSASGSGSGAGSGAGTGRGSGHVVRRPTRRRWRRPAPWVAAGALAGVAAFAVVAVGPWELLPGTGDDASDIAGAAAEEGGDELSELFAQGPLLAATGTEYTADELPATLQLPEHLTASAPADGAVEAEDYSDSAGPPRLAEGAPAEAVPPELAGLWADPWSCLATVGQVAPEAEVTAADFAYLDGEPAVVIWLREVDGSHWVWAVGPSCGVEPGDSDQRHVRRLG